MKIVRWIAGIAVAAIAALAIWLYAPDKPRAHRFRRDTAWCGSLPS